jgi:type III pantothenate kinase
MSNDNKYIAIDLGNTTAKFGVFVNGVMMEKKVGVIYESLAASVNKFCPNNVIISSVNQKVEELVNNITAPVLVLNHHTPIPISNKYATPETLGRDRLAAVVGANAMENQRNTLVIDVGTCITYDFLNDDNAYLGGGISPGVHLKFQALHNFTANLPLIQEQEVDHLIGDTTENAIISGVINGTIAEIEEIIRMYKDKFSHLRIIMCGGGASRLHGRLKTDIKLAPDLVLVGLNRILEYNV